MIIDHVPIDQILHVIFAEDQEAVVALQGDILNPSPDEGVLIRSTMGSFAGLDANVFNAPVKSVLEFASSILLRSVNACAFALRRTIRVSTISEFMRSCQRIPSERRPHYANQVVSAA